MIKEKSNIKGLIKILKCMHIPKDDILTMELYYEDKK